MHSFRHDWLSYTKTYMMAETTVPVDYDGFGTFTIHTIGPKRWVLLEEEHVSWQTQRSASGMYSHAVCDGPHLLRAAVDRLWARLVGTQKKE